MKKKISTCILFYIITFSLLGQERNLEKEIINDIIKPYRNSLIAYIHASKDLTDERRNIYFSYFEDYNVLIPNDIIMEQKKDLDVKQFALLIKPYLSKNDQGQTFTFDYNCDYYQMCTQKDTSVFINIVTDYKGTKTLQWQRIRIRQKEGKLKIYAIERISEAPKDTDDDGVPDNCDDCKDRKGSRNAKGCPNDDLDGDGIANKDDNCPNDFGKKELNGCPDKDNDGIADKNDNCPNDFGKKELNGCPDKDGDEIADKYDDCPNDFGKKEFNGCPDRDEDGTADIYDKCPNTFGKKELNGCPEKEEDKIKFKDSDKDGIADINDDCPTEFGTKETNGCPDIDKDYVADKYDNCPTEYGLKDLNGCPDKDGDKIADKYDNCPDQYGSKDLLGCPDTDRDGIADKYDNCPKEYGDKKMNGCPDSDNDGIANIYDDCPDQFGVKEMNGCPKVTPKSVTEQYTRPTTSTNYETRERTYTIDTDDGDKAVRFGIGLSGGAVTAIIDKGDTDIKPLEGYGYSPSVFTNFKLSNTSYLQLELSYSKKVFSMSNLGDDSEFNASSTYFYQTDKAEFNFDDYRAYLRFNFADAFSIGGYYGQIFKAYRTGQLAYDEINAKGVVSSFSQNNYEYDFLDEKEYPTINGGKPITQNIYGVTLSYDYTYESNLVLSLGLDYNMSNIINNKYQGWKTGGSNIDLYPSELIHINTAYLYIKAAYIF
jgi:Thrombospondin type 3 repeat